MANHAVSDGGGAGGADHIPKEFLIGGGGGLVNFLVCCSLLNLSSTCLPFLRFIF